MDKKEVRKIIRETLEQLGESRMVTFTSDILWQAGKNIEGLKPLNIQSMGDGSVGLYRYKDGNVYEIQIRPASLIKDKDRWGNILKPKENPTKKMYRDLGLNK